MNSDDSDCYTRPWFPINHVKEKDIDLSVPPANGMEYLQRVMLETKQCKRVVTVRPNVLNKVQSHRQLPKEEKEVSLLAPCVMWQDTQVSNFSQLRQRIAKWKVSVHRDPQIALPSSDNKMRWHHFCLGVKCDIEDDEHAGSPPLLSTLVNIGQPMIDLLLNWHSEWLEECNHITHLHGQWIFALMSCLELPLHPDTCSTIRCISRLCQQIRGSMIDPEPSELAAVNLIICLVGRYFNQTDLAD